jgi:hypothetical protein
MLKNMLSIFFFSFKKCNIKKNVCHCFFNTTLFLKNFFLGNHHRRFDSETQGKATPAGSCNSGLCIEPQGSKHSENKKRSF